MYIQIIYLQTFYKTNDLYIFIYNQFYLNYIVIITFTIHIF
jgi:hypothetical protein